MARSQERLHEAHVFLASRRFIAVLKGALAYTITIMLPFVGGFARLVDVPAIYSAMVLISISGFPGKSTGECIQGVLLSLFGVAIGAANFTILAKLRVSLPAQAVVFAFMIYVLALIKASNIKFFTPVLLAVLMTFNGVYTSISTGSFQPNNLESSFEAYLLASAIVIAVNLLVFPYSSERQLRETLVASLEHIATFSHLLAKTYTLEITEEEKILRDRLNQSIRADFGLLTQKMGAASIEINWSKWSIQDYQELIGKTRTMQLNLITLHSSLAGYNSLERASVFSKHFLPTTIGPFHQLRRDVHNTIVEIQRELGSHSSINQGPSGYERYFDLERQEAVGDDAGSIEDIAYIDEVMQPTKRTEKAPQSLPAETEPERTVTVDRPRRPTFPTTMSERDLDNQLKEVSAKLEAEVDQHDFDKTRPPSPAHTSASATVAGDSSPATPTRVTASAIAQELAFPKSCASRLRFHFEAFEKVQRDLLTQVIVNEKLHSSEETLLVKQPRPSLFDEYGCGLRQQHHVDRPEIKLSELLRQRIHAHTHQFSHAHAHGEGSASVMMVTGMDRSQGTGHSDRGSVIDDSATDVDIFDSNQSLMRVFSMLFALDNFTKTLASCHTSATRKDSKGRKRQHRLRFHLFGKIKDHHATPKNRVDGQPTVTNDPNAAIVDPSYSQSVKDEQSSPAESELSMEEALAILEGREYVKRKLPLIVQLDRAAQVLQSPMSIYAGKVTAAALVFAALIWAEGSRSFFLNYGLNTSLLTVVVALNPTLGQSLRSFVLQIAGSSIGYLIGLAILEIFKDVGGHHFNPYGVVCLVGVYALPMSYLLYERPTWFTGVLLAMNGTGVLIMNEYINVVHNHNTAYGEPPIRVGKALAGLAIAIAIVLAFQLLVLRNPARRTLRKALASLVYSNLSYMVILHAFVQATMPVNPSYRVPQAAINRVVQGLQKREKRIQEQILAIMPLVAFSKDEPDWAKPFEVGAIMKIIQANQLILDRLGESRSAIGTTPFSEHLLRDLEADLYPYRMRMSKMVKSHFVLCAASLSSKTPLPHDTDADDWVANVVHDALVQSQTFAKKSYGQESISSGEFTRYWFYLLGISSIIHQLRVIEEGCKTLFGVIENNGRLS